MPSITPLSNRTAHRLEAKYNVVSEYPNLGLHSAAAKGNIGLVQYALTHGQPHNSVLDGIVPLHAACSGGNELVVKLLLDFGADVNAQRLPRRYSDRNKSDGAIIGSSGSTPLHFAAANGHAAIVRILLARGADPTKADKHGTKPETLAANFGHDDVVTILQEYEASMRLAGTMNGLTSAEASSSSQPTPPSPTRSRKVVKVQRSLENLLTRTLHPSASPAPSRDHSGSSSHLPTSSSIDLASPFAFTGTLTPLSPIPPSSADYASTRRPSLPFAIERHIATPPTSKPSSRPRSAGQDADQPTAQQSGSSGPGSSATVPLTGQKKLASKISLLNIFKKGHDQSTTSLGGVFGASSPNLVASLQPPVDVVTTRPRSSTEDLGSSDGSRGLGNRNAILPPPVTSAPAVKTTFFPPKAATLHGQMARAQQDPENRTRADSGATLSSTSSYEGFLPVSTSPPSLSAVALHNWRSRKDRAASESAATKPRSPLQTEWVRDSDGNIRHDLPAVIADGEDEMEGHPPPAAALLPSPTLSGTSGPMTSNPRPPPVPIISSTGHARSNSNQSAKALRFDSVAPLNEYGTPVAQRHPTSPPSHHLPGSSIARRVSQKALRTSASVGSLWSRKNSGSSLKGRKKPRPSSAGSSHEFAAGGQFPPPQSTSPDVLDEYDSEEEDEEDGEEADLVEPLWKNPARSTYGRSGSSSLHHHQRPTMAAMMTPLTTSSASSLYTPVSPQSRSQVSMVSPDTAGTFSSGGRPWALPNESETSVHSQSTNSNTNNTLTPSITHKHLAAVGPSTKPLGANGDNRLRGASVSSSLSTDTTSSSSAGLNPPATTSSNGTSDTSSPNALASGSRTRSNSSTPIASTLVPALRNFPYRPSNDLLDDGYDSASSHEFTKNPTPIPVPVLLRTVNTHAQAQSLVEKAERQILDLADLPPDSAGLSGTNLSAQLAAYGETLAVERRFARGEAQKTAWVNRRTVEDDSDDDVNDDGMRDEDVGKYPSGEYGGPRRGPLVSSHTSPGLNRIPSLDYTRNIPGRSVSGPIRTTRNRPVGSKHIPPNINTSTIPSYRSPIRTTPSNIGPQYREMKTPRKGEDGTGLAHLTLSGIEITKTLPTPTDSPHSGIDMASNQMNVTGEHDDDESIRLPEMSDASIFYPSTPGTRSRTPDFLGSESQSGLPLRGATLPASATFNGFNMSTGSDSADFGLPDDAARGHGRTGSSGTNIVQLGPPDYLPPRSESRMAKKLGGFKNFVQTFKGKT